MANKVVSAEEYDQKREALDVANAQVKQALENIYEARVALGLPGEPPREPAWPMSRPTGPELFLRSASARGTTPECRQARGGGSSYDLTPKKSIEEFYKRDPGGDIDRIYAQIVQNAPDLKRAQASLMQAQRDLDQAKLDLRYCKIVAEIDGVITRRNVNPGNNVQVGQSLMAIRSMRDIWVDANFKETQLRDLRIGQRVELELDMYGGKRTFEGRISGFTNGTGSTLSLLPAQNATGNFVKVVQRVPVRIDVINYDPDKAPLFVGLSVTPSVDLKTAPTGKDAGKFLQEQTHLIYPPTPNLRRRECHLAIALINSMRLMPLCLLASVLAFFSGQSFAAPVTITAVDAARSIHLRVGEEIVLKLENNPSTGYSWILNEAKHPGLVSLGKPTYADHSPMPGAGGLQSWNFRAVERGVQSLRFEYQRPWEKKPPVKIVDFLVVIR